MKKLVLVLMALLMVMAAVPSLAEGESITGTWYAGVMGLTMGSAEFREDGTVAMSAETDEGIQTIEATWEQKDQTVILTWNGQSLELTLDGDKMSSPDGTTFTREPGLTKEQLKEYMDALERGENPEPPEGASEEALQMLQMMYGMANEVAGSIQVSDGAMTHDDYAAAELESEVTVETYVQATQSWWDNKITVYAQSPDGAYFIYEMACSEEDAAKLVPGTPIRVKGFKAEWSGEVEIVDASFEILEGVEPFIAEPQDVTALLGTDELLTRQNELVSFKGMTVEAYDETGAAFAYKNAENKTDDLYFKVSRDGQTYDFCVEFYLCGQDTEVYKAVEGLNVGDVIDMEGFLYWYNGANPHIIKIAPAE